MKVRLVKKIEDHEMSPLKDYIGLRNNTICNLKLASKLLGIPLRTSEFIVESYNVQIVEDISYMVIST